MKASLSEGSCGRFCKAKSLSWDKESHKTRVKNSIFHANSLSFFHSMPCFFLFLHKKTQTIFFLKKQFCKSRRPRLSAKINCPHSKKIPLTDFKICQGNCLFEKCTDFFFAFFPRAFYKGILVKSKCYVVIKKYHTNITLLFYRPYILVFQFCNRRVIAQYDFLVNKFCRSDPFGDTVCLGQHFVSFWCNHKPCKKQLKDSKR